MSLWRLFPDDPEALEEAKGYLRTFSLLMAGTVFLSMPLNLTTITEAGGTTFSITSRIPLAIALCSVYILSFFNARAEYRFVSPRLTLIILEFCTVFIVCMLLMFMGSVTSAVPMLLFFFLVFFTVYVSEGAGLLMCVFSMLGYLCVLMLERTGSIPYAPNFPGVIQFDDFDSLQLLVALRVIFTLFASYILSLFISRSLRKRNIELQRLNKVKDYFVGIVAHDIRSPLTSIRASSELISMQGSDMKYEEVQRFSTTIIDEVDRLTKMLTDLLDIEKMEQGKYNWQWKKDNIGEIVKIAVRNFEAAAHKKNISLKVVIESEIVEIILDRERLMQLLVNLLSNALKFTPEGGIVTAKVVDSENTVSIILKDTGPGIDADSLGTIFDRYSQTELGSKKGGSGLGLSIAAEIARGHGGTIRAASIEGQGTEMIVELPKLMS